MSNMHTIFCYLKPGACDLNYNNVSSKIREKIISDRANFDAQKNSIIKEMEDYDISESSHLDIDTLNDNIVHNFNMQQNNGQVGNRWENRNNHLTNSGQIDPSLNGTVGFNLPNGSYQVDHDTQNSKNNIFSQQFLQANPGANQNAISANTLNGNAKNNKYFYETNTVGSNYNTIQAKIAAENYFTETNSNFGTNGEFEQDLSNIEHDEDHYDTDNQGSTADQRGSGGNMYAHLGKNVMDYMNKNQYSESSKQRDMVYRQTKDENNSNLVNIANGILSSEIMQRFNNTPKGQSAQKEKNLNGSLLNSCKNEDYINYQQLAYNNPQLEQTYNDKKMNTLQYENYISSNNTQSLAMRGVVGSEDQYDKKSSRRTPRNNISNTIGHNDQNRVFSINSTNDNMKFGTMNQSSVARQTGPVQEIIEENEQNYYSSETTPRDDNLQYNLRKTHAHSIASSEFSAFHFNDEMKDFFKEEFKGKIDQDTVSNQHSNNPELISSGRINANTPKEQQYHSSDRDCIDTSSKLRNYMTDKNSLSINSHLTNAANMNTGVSPAYKKNPNEMYSIQSSKLTYNVNNNYNSINQGNSMTNYDQTDKESNMQYKSRDFSDNEDFKRNRRLITKASTINE